MSQLEVTFLRDGTARWRCSCGVSGDCTISEWYQLGVSVHNCTWTQPTTNPQDLYEEWEKYLTDINPSRTPIQRSDRRAAVKEAEAILHLNYPLVQHDKQGCHCRECEKKFFTGYLQYVEDAGGKTNAV